MVAVVALQPWEILLASVAPIFAMRVGLVFVVLVRSCSRRWVSIVA